MIPTRLLSLSFVLLSSSLSLYAQTPQPGTTKDDEGVVKAGLKDPFTGGDEKLMKQLGVVAYGPLVWADDLRTGQIDKVLGEKRIIWMETEHFQFAFNFSTAPVPEDAEARKIVNAELARLNKKCNKLPARASKIETWVRLHLYAMRAEELYADFAKLVGHDDASGTCLGQKGKFPILLFQKKSDLARYLDRFCGIKSETPMRHYYNKTGQNGLALSAEAEEVRDEAFVYAQFRNLLVETFCSANGGAPRWLSVGLAHWYERKIPSRVIMAAIKDGESVDVHTQHLWHDKMKNRAQHEKLLVPFAEFSGKVDFGYYDHLQAWSRVDWLLTTDREKFGKFMAELKNGYSSQRQIEALQTVYGMEPEVFDAKWREWVLKTYK
ncbi:MAG: hypothetical protein JNK15_15975 [Planctomycetes bacterium]|nr:hypothetical protein [Planctomycetota bacterium]